MTAWISLSLFGLKLDTEIDTELYYSVCVTTGTVLCSGYYYYSLVTVVVLSMIITLHYSYRDIIVA